MGERFSIALKRLSCALFGHNRAYLTSPPGVMGGWGAPWRCLKCGVSHEGFPYPPMPPTPPSKSNESTMTNIKSRIQVLSPKAGDTIALMFPRLLTQDQRVAICDRIKSLLPDGVKVLLLDGGVTMAHVESPSSATATTDLIGVLKSLTEEVKGLRYDMEAGQRSAAMRLDV